MGLKKDRESLFSKEKECLLYVDSRLGWLIVDNGKHKLTPLRLEWIQDIQRAQIVKDKEKKEVKKIWKDEEVAHCLQCSKFFEARLKQSTEEYICICPNCANSKPVKSLNNLEVGDEVENNYGFKLWIVDVVIGRKSRSYLVEDCEQEKYLYNEEKLMEHGYRFVKSHLSVIDEMIEYFELQKTNYGGNGQNMHSSQYNKFITYLKELKK